MQVKFKRLLEPTSSKRDASLIFLAENLQYVNSGICILYTWYMYFQSYLWNSFFSGLHIDQAACAESSTSGCAIDASGPTSPISLMKKWWFNSLLRQVLWDVFEKMQSSSNFGQDPCWRGLLTRPGQSDVFGVWLRYPKCINGSTESRHLLPRRLRPMASAMKAWVNSHKSTHKFEPQGHQSKIPTLQTWSNRANWDLLQSRSVISSLTHEKDKKKPAAWRPGQSLKFHLRACSLQASRLRPPVKLYRKQQANGWQGWWCLVLKVFLFD